MKFFCKSYWVYTVKDFIGYPLFTILLLFYVFEVGKAKSATQSVLMILTLNEWAIPEKFSRFYFTPDNFISLTLPLPPVCFFPLYCLYCNFWLPPSFWYKHLYPYSLTRIHYCNWKYISEWSFYEIKNFYFCIKEISILKSNYF